MKISSFLIYLLSLIVFQASAQKNDLKRLTLHGNVKSNRESSYQPIEKEGKILNGELEYYYYNTFNHQGNKTENSRYSSKDILEKTITFHYDSKGNVIEEIVLSGDGSKTSYSYEYEFDQTGNWTKKIKFEEKKAVNILVREIVYF